jgi:hypothetical protein
MDALLTMKASQAPAADTTLISQLPSAGDMPRTDTALAALLPVFLENDMVLAHLQQTAAAATQ